MSRTVGTVIMLLLVVFLTALTAGHGTSQQKREGKMQMKGMDHKAMKGPVGPCMEPMGRKPEAPIKGKVAILKPANGTVVKSRTVKVTFDFPQMGHSGNHLHLYLDGRCKNMIRRGKSYYLSGLREGKHKIELRIVTENHFEVGPSASVEITVKRK